jgi:hypothetical protein
MVLLMADQMVRQRAQQMGIQTDNCSVDQTVDQKAAQSVGHSARQMEQLMAPMLVYHLAEMLVPH